MRGKLLWLCWLLLCALLALALRRDAAIYQAHLRLDMARKLIIAAAKAPQGHDVRPWLLSARDELEDLREALPLDVRVPFLLGSVSLLLHQPAEAMVRYREALAIEERPEIDLNLSRAHREAGDAADAAEDALRATWIAPEINSSLPEETRKALWTMTRQLEASLKAGDVTAIPRLADSDAATGQNNR